MRLSESPILDLTLRALFPFVVIFSFQLFSYGANSPGGGFQAGVVFGTIVIALDLLWERPVYPTSFYERIELLGLAILWVAFLVGWAWEGHPFAAFYAWRAPGLLFSNAFLWLLNLAIFLEVAGSIVLIVRRLLGEEE